MVKLWSKLSDGTKMIVGAVLIVVSTIVGSAAYNTIMQYSGERIAGFLTVALLCFIMVGAIIYNRQQKQR